MQFLVDPCTGRSVVATRNYQPGDIILQEKAFVMASIFPEKQKTERRCLYCFVLIDSKRHVQAVQCQWAQASPTVAQQLPIATVPNHLLRVPVEQLPPQRTTMATNDENVVAATAASTGEATRTCGGWYCSTTCFEAHHTEHESNGECAVLDITNKIRHRVPHEDFNTLQVVALALARAAATGYSLQLRLTGGIQSTAADSGYTVETVGLGLEVPLQTFEDLFAPACSSNQLCHVPPKHPSITAVPLHRSSTFAAMQYLVTNRTWMDAEIRTDYEALYDTYETLRARGSSSSNAKKGKSQQKNGFNCTDKESHKPSDQAAAAAVISPLAFVSREVFVSLCCAFQANGFGLWGAKAQGIAAGFFPLSSFFNHSCAPNVARDATGRFATFFAVRPIQKGESIFLSYVDFKLARGERRAKLKATYSFDCGCTRCNDIDGGDYENRGRYDVPVCGDCKAKVLRPVPLHSNAKEEWIGVCPCCAGVETNWSLD